MGSSDPVPHPVGRSFGGWFLAMPRWKKWLVLSSLAAVAVGGVLSWSSGGASGAGSGVSGLAAHATASGGSANPDGQPRASEGVFRLGFSFLAGFCLGSFLRATLKFVAVAVGFWLAMTFVLSYFGLVTVDWQAIDGLWGRFCGNIESEWGDFQRFVTGSLPQAGLAAAGLAVGLKRH
ncbi:MAG: FUN14 domain-containing protein [Planctomycetes bacterium]|nr:FUN14 domain-containing protein [Planctomycetota bacterium]